MEGSRDPSHTYVYSSHLSFEEKTLCPVNSPPMGWQAWLVFNLGLLLTAPPGTECLLFFTSRDLFYSCTHKVIATTHLPLK